MTKVLVVATSRKTRGGITSVVKAHEQGKQWKKYHCRWIETHRDGNALIKIIYLVRGLIEYIFLLPFCGIVHIHFSEPLSAIRKRYFFLPLAKLMHKKIIVHFHAFSPESTIYGKCKDVYDTIFNQSDCVIVLSEYWKKEVDSQFHLQEKIRVVYNPCTTEILEGKYEKKKQILFAGTINARKGFEVLIKAFALVADKNPEWNVVFAGNGEIEKGRLLAQELNISSQVHFLGWVNGQAKDKAFKESSIFCLPSYAEGFPMSVLDAWAYGLPVITTPVGGIPDVAVDGHNMLLFEPGDANALAEQIQRLISDVKLYDKISKESCHFAETTFNMKTINGEIGEIYEKLANQ